MVESAKNHQLNKQKCIKLTKLTQGPRFDP